jgi:hypothetical protein
MLKPIPVSPLMAARIQAQANKPLFAFMRKPGAAKEVKDVSLLLATKNGQMQRVYGLYQVDGKTKKIGHGLGMRLASDYLIGQQEGPTLFRPMFPGQFENPGVAPKPPGVTGTVQSVSSYHTAPTHTASSSVYSTPFDVAGTSASNAKTAPAPLHIARKPLASAAKTTVVASSPPLSSAEDGPVVNDSASRWSQDLLANAFAQADTVGAAFLANPPKQTAIDLKGATPPRSRGSERPASQLFAIRESIPDMLQLDGIALQHVTSAPATPRPGLLAPAQSHRGRVSEVNWFTASGQPSPGLNAYMPGETVYSNTSALASSVVLSRHERSAPGLLATLPPEAPFPRKGDMLDRSNTFSKAGKQRYNLARLKKDDRGFLPNLTATDKTSHQRTFRELLARLVPRSPVPGDHKH